MTQDDRGPIQIAQDEWGRLTEQRARNAVAGLAARMRGAGREEALGELAEALAVDGEQHSWGELLAMVVGVRAIADIALGLTEGSDVGEERRRQLLVSFGVAEQWAAIAATAEREGPSMRKILGQIAPVVQEFGS